MKKRAILSWILLVCGFICVYNSIGISELLFSSNQVAQNIVTVILVALGIFFVWDFINVFKEYISGK